MHRVTALQKTGAPPSSGLDILRKKIENVEDVDVEEDVFKKAAYKYGRIKIKEA